MLAISLVASGDAHGATPVSGSGDRLRFAPASPAPNHGGPQGYLGIDVRDVSEEQVSALHLPSPHGAYIVRVDHDGPAAKAGLHERDVVLQMNGAAIEGEEHIRRMLREMPPGRGVTLLISRDGQQLTIAAVMADREQVERQAWADHLPAPGPQAPVSALPTFTLDAAPPPQPGAPAPQSTSKYSKGFIGTLLMSPSYTGAILEMMGPQLADFFGVAGGHGLLVRSVEINSPAAQAGLHAGDVVIRANAHAVASMGDWARQIKDSKGRPLAVVVLRDKAEKTLTLRPDGKRRSSLEFPPAPFPTEL